MFFLLTFALFLLIQLYFYGFLFGKLTSYESSELRVSSTNRNKSKGSSIYYNRTYPGVSVIVCAHNEATHLERHLTILAEQGHPNYEILLVDDGSTDETHRIMKGFQEKFGTSERPVQVLRIPPSDSSGKKKALSRGIEIAAHDIVLLTDADCRPNSSNWISEMTSELKGASEIVLGYGAYMKVAGSFLNKVIRYETFLTALQYFSHALSGRPYMGVGRNLAYKKNLFDRANGFDSHMNLKSGDDDLFINQVATADNTAICLDPEGFTVSEPKSSLTQWIRQKRRHITTSHHYQTRQKIELGAFYLSQLGFYVLAIILLTLNAAPLIVIPLVILRFLIFYYTILRSAQKLLEKDLVVLAPLYEISVIFMQLYVFVANTFSPPKKW